MSGSICGSPLVGNYFDHPHPHPQPAQHTEIMSVGPGDSVVSINPLEVMFCSCCGSQNVIGRPSCWRCSTLFSSVTANNGANQIQVSGNLLGAISCPPPSLSPSETLRFRGAGAANASIASAAAGIAPAIPKVGRASIAAPSRILASGWYWWSSDWFSNVFQLRVNMGQCSFTPGGPRTQGGYLLPRAQVKLMRDLPLEGLLPPTNVLRLFRFIPPRTVHHQMGHHHQREQVVDMVFNLRKMDGYQVERLKRMFTRLNLNI